jgi:hypothetical protein
MRRGVRLRTAFLGAAALAAALVGSAPVRGAEAQTRLDPRENQRLMHGETITRTQTLEQGGRRYVGGVTYTVVDASADELEAMLTDVSTYEQILPRTKYAQIVGRDAGDLLVELHQGNMLVEAAYTIRVRKNGHECRFWLDPHRPHGIEDAWGFFRVEPLAQVTPGTPRALLTYGVLVDVGDGLVRDLFEERIRAVVLTVPQRVREYVWREVRPHRRSRA